jgi:hypothetical protein
MRAALILQDIQVRRFDEPRRFFTSLEAILTRMQVRMREKQAFPAPGAGAIRGRNPDVSVAAPEGPSS